MSIVLEQKFMQDYIRCANDGWEWKFHERNGGNLSYRMRAEEVEACKSEFTYDKEWVALGVTAENLANEYFVVTGSGKFFRNVILNPAANICILRLNDKGDSYQVVWGLVEGGKPSSEFPSHVTSHSVKVAMSDDYRIIYHAHPVNIISLTFVTEIDDKALTLALWESMTECSVIFPEGVGFVRWMVPGGAEVALETKKLMEKYNVVVWEAHGLFCAGDTFDNVFGLMHTVEKAAEIRMKVLATGLPFRRAIDAQGLRDCAVRYSLNLNEDLLDE